MGKYETYLTLQALGGTATCGQISRNLRDKFPEASYWTSVSHSLRRLAQSSTVKHDESSDTWTIISEFGERNVVTIGTKGRIYRHKN